MDVTQTKAKMLEYRGFIDDVLRPQLQQAKLRKQKSVQEIQEYQELLENLKNLKERITNTAKNTNSSGETITEQEESQQPAGSWVQEVDLGYGKVFCDATAMTTWDGGPPVVFIHVGMGFHVELTIEEGIQFVQKRLHFLETQVLQHRKRKLQQIEEHVKSSEFILNELSRNFQSQLRI